MIKWYETVLHSFSIMKQHASLVWEQNEVTLKPATSGAKTKVNGLPLTGERVLKHLDRILFGKRFRKKDLESFKFLESLYQLN